MQLQPSGVGLRAVLGCRLALLVWPSPDTATVSLVLVGTLVAPSQIRRLGPLAGGVGPGPHAAR